MVAWGHGLVKMALMKDINDFNLRTGFRRRMKSDVEMRFLLLFRGSLPPPKPKIFHPPEMLPSSWPSRYPPLTKIA